MLGSLDALSGWRAFDEPYENYTHLALREPETEAALPPGHNTRPLGYDIDFNCFLFFDVEIGSVHPLGPEDLTPENLRRITPEAHLNEWLGLGWDEGFPQHDKHAKWGETFKHIVRQFDEHCVAVLLDMLVGGPRNAPPLIETLKAQCFSIAPIRSGLGASAPCINRPNQFAKEAPHQSKEYATNNGSKLSLLDPSRLSNSDVPTRRWLVDGLIPQGTVTMLSGDGGVGKSLLAMQLATCVGTQRSFLGLKTSSGRVIGLFCEDTEDELHRRQVDINSGLGLSFQDLVDLAWVVRVGQDTVLLRFDTEDVPRTTEVLDNLKSTIIEQEPSLVILDGLADLFGGNENSRSQARQFVSHLTHLCQIGDTTILLLAHPSLSGLSTGSGLSGSTAWNNSVRSRLYFSRPKENAYGEITPDDRVLTVVKANYAQSGLEQKLRFDAGVFVQLDDSNTTDHSTRQKQTEKVVLDLLRAFKAEGRRVTASPTSPHYAPKLFLRRSEAAGFRKRELEAATERLFSRKIIREQLSGPPSRPIRQIVEVAGRPDHE